MGCKKEIPTPLSGQVRVTIPEGTQHGKVLRVKKEGVPNVHGQGRGDLLIHVMIETPTHLTTKQKELLKELGQLETPKNQPKKNSYLERIKVFFQSFKKAYKISISKSKDCFSYHKKSISQRCSFKKSQMSRHF